MFSVDEFDSHKCKLPDVRGQKTIETIDFLDVSCGDKKLMSARGVDGIIYFFKIVAREPLPVVTPKEQKNSFW